tara:strand:- start:1009 stop:2103 length:1095 start_codon:yes stop_codon:yes gene_type:complete
MEKEELLKLLAPIKPKVAFSESEHPDKPDYSITYNWAALPHIKGLQHEVPDNSFISITDTAEVDVFYIHPTGFFGQYWNCKIDKNIASYDRTELMLINQASAFNESCNIYAPHYRQATYYSYFDEGNNGFNAHDLAYQDIEEAFDYYLENFNNGKPFIIAAHSQGALHGQRLIHNRVQDSFLKQQMIAAYLIGYIIPEKNFKILFPGLHPSQSATDHHSIISWATVTEGHVRDRARTISWSPQGWTKEDMGLKIISTNPISWINDGSWYEASTSNLAITTKAKNYNFADRLAKNYSGSIKSITPTNLQDFSCKINQENGLLETKGILVEKIKKLIASGDLHNFDISLFWGSLRSNIKERISGFI